MSRPNDTLPRFRTALEQFIEERRLRDGVPGLSLAVVKGDRLVWARGFGVAGLAASRPATSATIYLWFSMTKIATATAVMKLAEDDLLDLDAPVTRYFDGFSVVSQPRPITVRHLLGHGSGLANPVPIRWVRSADAPAPDGREFLMRLLRRHNRLKFIPGERAAYSNLGYLVLGQVISGVAGVPYEEYVREELLAALGMVRTGFSYPEDAVSEAATGYQPLRRPLGAFLRAALPGGVVGPRQGRYVGFDPFYVNGAPYGGLVGGAEEASRLALLHLNGGKIGGRRMLSAESVAMMRGVIPNGGDRDFGLGWYRPHEATRQGRTFVEHLGGGAGFRNVMRLYPRESLGVVLMGNATRYDHEPILDAVAGGDWP